MTSSTPWSVKGIGPAAREAAKEQARRSGLTLGEWLTRRIREESDDAEALDEGPLTGALDRLASRIEVAEQRSTLAVTGIDQSVRGVLARLEAVEQGNGDLATRLDAAGARFDRLEGQSIPAVEGSLARLANQVYDADGRQREAIGDLRRELGSVNARLEAMEQARIAAGDPSAFGLAERLNRAEATTDAALRTLQASFAMLDSRLAAAESRLDGDENALSGALERRLGEIAGNLAAGVADARAELADQLRAETETRLGRVDQTLKAMEDHVEAAERRSSQAMERMGYEVLRVAEALNRKVEKSEQRAAAAIDRVGEDVGRALGAMDGRIQRTESAQAAALEKLGSDIARVAERLTERLGVAERRAAQAVDEVSVQVSRISERMIQRQDSSVSELSERIRQSEERTARLLDEARERLERRQAETPRRLAAESVDYLEEALDDVIAAPPFPEGPSLSYAAAQVQEVIYPDAVPFGQAMAPGFTPVEPEFGPEDIEAASDFSIPPAAETEADFVDGERVLPAPAPLFSAPQEDLEPQPQLQTDAAPAAEEPPLVNLVFGADAGFDAQDPPPADTAPAGDLAAAPSEPAPSAASTRELIERARAAARGASSDRGGPRPYLSATSAPAPVPFAPTPFTARRRRRKEPNRAVLAACFGFAAVMAAGGAVIYASGDTQGLLAKVTGGQFGGGGQTPRLAVALNPQPIGAQPPAALAGVVPAVEDPAAASLLEEGRALIEAGDNAGVEAVRQAANMGHPAAQRYLAGLFKAGEAGLTKDLAEARRWYERAAAGGDRTAMHETALMHYEGQGGPKNLTSAAQWFKRAAELGATDSQYNLGILYEEGYGVGKNPAEAYKWYLIAARDVDPDKRSEAAAAAERVKGEISREAQAAAERTAAAFTPQVQNASATQATADYLAVQRALGRLGYYQGLENGTLTPELQRAIREYQRDQGLTPNGVLDVATVERLATFVQ